MIDGTLRPSATRVFPLESFPSFPNKFIRESRTPNFTVFSTFFAGGPAKKVTCRCPIVSSSAMVFRAIVAMGDEIPRISAPRFRECSLGRGEVTVDKKVALAHGNTEKVI